MKKSKLHPLLRTTLILFAIFSTATNTYAYDFLVDGIYYNLNSDGISLTVTYKNTDYNSYRGNVVIPEKVTIGGKTYSVTAIGNYAFQNCRSLSDITIPNTITNIGVAFKNCSGLKTITIPESVSQIDDLAFDGCTALATLNFNAISCNANVTYIPFKNLNISTINIGNKVERIPHRLAYGLTKLTNVTIPNSVKIIGVFAFYGCSGLTNLSIGNSVTYIGTSAFQGCSGLTSLTIPNSVSTIEASAFRGCNSLTILTIPRSVTDIGNYAFQDCSFLKTLHFNAESCSDFSSTSTETPFYNLNITNIFLDNNVKRIPANFVNGLTKLNDITIGNSVNEIGGNAFYYCSSLTKVYINDLTAWCKITFTNSYSNPLNYAHHLFLNAQVIKDLVIPNGITTIKPYAFYGCSDLEDLTISNSITEIGNDAFRNCTGLANVNIGNKVSIIGNNAFSSCHNLPKITIPNSVTSIGNYAFNNCTALTTLTYNAVSCADFNTSYHPFNNTNISTINIGNNVQKIPAYFAYNKTKVTSISIPNSVTSIGNNTFYGCSGLTSISIPNSVNSIGNSAFSNCSGLTSITIGTGVSTIGNYAFQGCTAATKLTYNAVTCADFSSGNSHPFYGSNISMISVGSSVQKIPAYFAYNMTKVTSITIPNSVTSIGGYAFNGCTGLASISIGTNITNIGDYAFNNCTALTTLTYNAVSCADFNTSYHPFNNTNISTINIGNIVQKIPAYFAYNKTKVTSISIPNSVTFIGNYAFYGCSGLTIISIGTGVTAFGNNIFQNCTALTTLNYDAVSCADFNTSYHPFNNTNISTISIGNNVQKIPANFAYGMKKLSSVTVGNSVNSFGENAFYNCSGLSRVSISDLESWLMISFFNGDANPLKYAHHLFLNNEEIKDLVIPNSVHYIRFGAFFGCSGLRSVTIPNSVYSIYKSAFYECSGLTSVSISNSVSYLGNYVFYGCSGLTSITIPNLVKSIEEYTFYGCTNLRTVILPQALTSIGYSAFYDCSNLSDFILPSSLSQIGDWAFRGCSQLTNLEFPNTLTSIGEKAFCLAGLKSINIPSSVKSLGLGCFLECSKLENVILNADISSINDWTFSKCTSLYSINIPSTIESIGANAFSDCSPTMLIWNPKNCSSMGGMNTSNIEKVTIGNKVEIIPAGFVSNSKITSLVIPATVTTIGYNAFSGCNSLVELTWNAKKCTYMGNMSTSNITQVKIGSTVEELPSSFVAGSKITSVNLPNALTAISDYAFSGCNSLTSVTIPNSVTTINQCAFSNCDNMIDVSIGNSVNTIYRSAFVGCTKLMYVSCNAIMPPKYIPYNSYDVLFDDITYQNAILYAPDLTYGYYKQSEPWNKFMEIKAEPYSDSGVGFDAKVYPTSVRMDAGDESEECYFTFENKQYQPLLVTGLEPNNIYSTTYTRDWGADIPLKFYTSELKMVPEGGKMLTATAAQLMAETNMADEETMCGFDWRRLEGPDDYLGTRSYCPVYDGKMAGTLKNLSKDTWYKFRPFYKSSAGNVYYGDWVTFYSGDWGVEFDPVVYTYQSPAVTQTDATLQGVALRGSSEITEQGFEYWKSGTSNVKKVTASGERMSATVNGLDPETSYKFRAFVTSDGKTLRGSDVEFVTRSGEHHVDNVLDVNADGIVNIADMNVVINVILRGNNDRTCDVNGDGLVNISDLNAIISSILAN